MRLAILLIVPALLGAASVEDRETIQRSFPNATKLLVDNISGRIHVTGVAGSDLRFKAEKYVKAGSADALSEAKRDVKLDISQQGSFVRLYVDGPFREHDRGRRFYDYEVKFDYEIQVPFGTELILKTVNDGDIAVQGTTGNYEISNVNGAIIMDKVGGSGTAHTVNGPVKVWLSKNPTQTSDFKTVNGLIEVHFQPQLSADMKFKTLNGHVYTDFEVAALSPPPGTTDGRNGKFVYKGSRSTVGRVGKGGPELSFETINGDVRLQTKSE